MTSPARNVAVVFAFALAFVLSAAFEFRLADPQTFEFDLVPFYCGGSAVANGADPYRLEPLRSCEHAASAAYAAHPAFVVPDPLPAYDQAVFAALAHVEFGAVRYLWFALEFAAFAATVFLLARVCATGPTGVATALFVSDFWCSSLLGQLVPFAVLGLVLAAYGLGRRRAWLVALGCVLAMIEPHLGLPALLAVLLFGERRDRVAAAGAALFLGALSLVAMPAATTVEYVVRVLPAHVLSEIDDQDQFGTAYLLHRLGFAEAYLTVATGLLYVAVLAGALYVSRGVARTFGAGSLPLVATAFALLGSPFAHLPQLAAALPAAILLATSVPSPRAGAIVALLAVPWLDFANVIRILPVAVVALHVTIRRFCGVSPATSVVAVAFALAGMFAATYVATLHATGDVIHFGIARATDLAEPTWRTYVNAQQHRYRSLADIAKIPTVVAVFSLGVALARAAIGPAPQPALRAGRALPDMMS